MSTARKDCYWYDQCGSYKCKECDYYDPVGGSDDELVYAQNLKENIEEYQKLIREFSDWSDGFES